VFPGPWPVRGRTRRGPADEESDIVVRSRFPLEEGGGHGHAGARINQRLLGRGTFFLGAPRVKTTGGGDPQRPVRTLPWPDRPTAFRETGFSGGWQVASTHRVMLAGRRLTVFRGNSRWVWNTEHWLGDSCRHKAGPLRARKEFGLAVYGARAASPGCARGVE